MLSKKPPKYKKAFEQISRYGTVGLELGISVAIGITIGFYLDKWLNTSPWLTIDLQVENLPFQGRVNKVFFIAAHFRYCLAMVVCRTSCVPPPLSRKRLSR